MKESNFAYPSDQVLFFERFGYHWGDQTKGVSETATLNMSYMDGHVSARRIVKAHAQNLANATNRGWVAPAGEPFYYNTDGETNTLKNDADTVTYKDPNFYTDGQLK
jgi:prepilin-type processing-associated H-X9-DG protein